MSNHRDHDNEWWELAIAGCLLLAWIVLRTLWRHPYLGVGMAFSLGAYVTGGWWGVASVWASLLLTLVVWRQVGSESFDRSVTWRARGSLRGWWVYGRHWRRAMVMADLGDKYEGERFVPRLCRISSTSAVDRLEVRLLKGQKPADLQREAERLAHTFGQPACRVRTQRPGRVALEFTRCDTLATPIPPLAIPETVDLRAIPMGRREDGSVWTYCLIGRQHLVAGDTGSGKGSMAQSLIRGVCPVIRSGLLRLNGIDPKGGMELRAAGGDALYYRLATDDPQDQLALLNDLVARMRDRRNRLAGHTRLHVPTIDDPLELLLIDEYAALTAYKPPGRAARELYGSIDMATNLLLSQGRAVGFVVWAMLQDPRKEVLPNRDLMNSRIALRLANTDGTDMVLGAGARDLGADCSLIDITCPGTAWVWCDGEPEPTRVRASFPTDVDIAYQAAHYRPLPSGPVIDAEVIDLPGDEGAAA